MVDCSFHCEALCSKSANNFSWNERISSIFETREYISSLVNALDPSSGDTKCFFILLFQRKSINKRKYQKNRKFEPDKLILNFEHKISLYLKVLQ